MIVEEHETVERCQNCSAPNAMWIQFIGDKLNELFHVVLCRRCIGAVANRMVDIS